MSFFEFWGGVDWVPLGGNPIDLPSLSNQSIWLGGSDNQPREWPMLNMRFPNTDGLIIPRGTTAQRPNNIISGGIRYNTTNNQLEFSVFSSIPTSWFTVRIGDGLTSITAGDGLTGGVITESGTIALGGVTLTGPVTGTAVIGATSTSIATSLAANPTLPGMESMRLPVGTTTQRPSSPVAGDFRYNNTVNRVEFYNGSIWHTISPDNRGTITSITAGDGLTGGIITDSGTIALGSISMTGVTTGTAVIGATSTSIATSLADNPVLPGTESVRLPSGTTAQRPSSPTAGVVRYNSTINQIEFHNGTSWIDSIASDRVTSITAGNGLTGGTITTSGTITLGSISMTGPIRGTSAIFGDFTGITTSFNQPPVFSGNSVVFPGGSSANRPSNPEIGLMRYERNESTSFYAFWRGDQWLALRTS